MLGYGAHFDLYVNITPIDEFVVIHRTRAAGARSVHIDSEVCGAAARCGGAFRRLSVGLILRRRIGRRRRLCAAHTEDRADGSECEQQDNTQKQRYPFIRSCFHVYLQFLVFDLLIPYDP